MSLSNPMGSDDDIPRELSDVQKLQSQYRPKLPQFWSQTFFICEWMRNGDCSPSQFQAQADAINLICGAKTQANPENTAGVLTMAGKGVRVLATPTSDLGKILACMHVAWRNVQDALCNLLQSKSIFSSLEAARPRSKSAIQALCSLHVGLEKAKNVLQHCSECSKLYLAITGDSVLSIFEKERSVLMDSLKCVEDIVPQSIGCQVLLSWLSGLHFGMQWYFMTS